MTGLAGLCALTLAFGAGAGLADDLVFENARMRMTVGDDAIVKSLKATGDELLETKDSTPFMSVTQPRPYNNEIKLRFPHRRTREGK